MSFEGRKIIMTGGPTREWLDPVRFISNPSSGKMGYCLAKEACKISSTVVFIHGPVDIDLSGHDIKDVPVETTEDLCDAVIEEMEDRSILIMSAAPADYTPDKRSNEKIKKSGDSFILTLKRTPDVLKCVAEEKKAGKFKDSVIVGFAAETNNLREYALDKLKRKNLDMICLNDVSREDSGFGKDTNAMTLFTRHGKEMELPVMTKNNVAKKILSVIEREFL